MGKLVHEVDVSHDEADDGHDNDMPDMHDDNLVGGEPDELPENLTVVELVNRLLAR